MTVEYNGKNRRALAEAVVEEMELEDLIVFAVDCVEENYNKDRKLFEADAVMFSELFEED